MIEEEWDALKAGMYVPGGFPLNGTSVVLENARNVKSGPGRLYGLAGLNTKAAQQFIQLHDSEGIPADGAVPVVIITVAASANFSLDYDNVGRWFYRGIVICNSSTSSTKTIGSADCWFDAQFV